MKIPLRICQFREQSDLSLLVRLFMILYSAHLDYYFTSVSFLFLKWTFIPQSGMMGFAGCMAGGWMLWTFGFWFIFSSCKQYLIIHTLVFEKHALFFTVVQFFLGGFRVEILSFEWEGLLKTSLSVCRLHFSPQWCTLFSFLKLWTF